ncbi:MAG: alpha/beta hydrolase [Bryobacteraceae bacterium]
MIHNRFATIDGLQVFYREAGPQDAKTIVLLHGFPSSSHMFRDLIPKLAESFHVIAPDYIGFGYSSHPSVTDYEYTFDNLTSVVEKLLFTELGLTKFSLYVQDYGAPVGFRLASRHPEAIEGIVVQNGNAYLEGISPAFDALKPFWANRNSETEIPVRALLTIDTTRFQYTHGIKDPSTVSPDSYTFDQALLDRPGNDQVQLALFHNYTSNVALYGEWQAYFRKYQPPTLIVWGKHDPFFTVEGAKAFQRDLPNAELHLLDSGHFALEDHAGIIAQHMARFLKPAATKAA